MTDTEYMIGVDIGTSGCKAVVVNSEGQMIFSKSEEYPTYYPHPGWAEQNPNDWYEALKKIFTQLVSESTINPNKIISIALDGQDHTPVFLDKNWKILRRAIPWTDQRSIEEVVWINKEIGLEKLIKITYNRASTPFTLPQIMWVKKNQPDIWRQIHKILIAKDYVRGRLTEEIWATDHSDASCTLIFDGEKFDWSDELCELTQISKDTLPEILPSTEIIGELNKSAAKDLGLPEKIPVAVGASDVAAENLAAGTVSPGQSFIKLATAGVLQVITDVAQPDPKGNTMTYCLPTFTSASNGWFTKTGTVACATSHRWFRDVFCTEEKNVANRLGESAYSIINDMASKVPVGSEGLFFHPHLIGEGSPYWNPYLKGSFYGITLRHRKEHFCRAVLEGLAYSIKASVSIFKNLGLKIQDSRLIGGGSESPVWRRIVSDIFNITILKPEYGDASFGSALLGGIAVNHFKDFKDATFKCTRIVDRLEPIQENAEKYDKLFKIYMKIDTDLIDTAQKLHQTLKETRNN